MLSDHVIEVRGLRMRYGATDVLDGVDFSVSRGEVVVLLGPNGAGKTTTIEVLEGFRARSAGEVRVLGVDPARAGDGWRARVGIVLQSWRDHARWTPRRLLAHLGDFYAPYATPDRPRPHDTEELLAMVEAERLADRILILAAGRIVADGTADALARRVGSHAEVRWAQGGQRFVHASDDATAFVRDLFAQHGDAIEDLEVRRASLEETYIAMVQQHESGAVVEAAATLAAAGREEAVR